MPAVAFVTVRVATPLDAVAVPSPVTLPVPPVWAKVTRVELSFVTVFPAASCTVAVKVWSSPERVEPPCVSASFVAAPWPTV